MQDITKKVKSLRTSDRLLFKRCRRKFVFQSELGMHLETISSTPVQFWLGTGVHFVLEDYHGHNKFKGDVHLAFEEYARNTIGHINTATPEFQEAHRLGHGMLDNYLDWLPGLKGFETLWIDGVPMCEVRLLIPLGIFDNAGQEIHYSATIDRIVKDEHNRLWIVDYKTAKTINTEKLPLDTQITAYHWAIYKQYGIEVEGMIYIQMLKAVPDAPNQLKNGSFSKAKNQATSYRMYRKALMDTFGEIPEEYKEILQLLKSQQGFLDNKYVKVDFVRRNHHQIMAEEKKIYAEAADIFGINGRPKFSPYPNPTKDCSWDCTFKQVCVSMDDGGDYKQILANNFRKQGTQSESWRADIKYPGDVSKQEEDILTAENWLR